MDLYFGQKTTIALRLCLHLFLHLRQRLLYVLLPVSGFMKKSHSCFVFFDNLGIVKTPFTCLNRERHFAPPYLQINFPSHLVGNENGWKLTLWPIFFITPSLVRTENAFLGGVFEKLIFFNIYPSTHLDKGAEMHTQNCRFNGNFLKNIFTPLLVWTVSKKVRVFRRKICKK